MFRCIYIPHCLGVLLYNVQVYLHCTIFRCTYIAQCWSVLTSYNAQCSGVLTLHNVQVYIHCTMFRCTYIVQCSGVLTLYNFQVYLHCTCIVQCSGVQPACVQLPRGLEPAEYPGPGGGAPLLQRHHHHQPVLAQASGKKLEYIFSVILNILHYIYIFSFLNGVHVCRQKALYWYTQWAHWL